MTTFNKKLLKYAQNGDTIHLKLFFDSNEDIIVEENDCEVDSCGYCENYIPKNPIENEYDDIVEILQSKFPISWKDDGDYIICSIKKAKNF